MSISSVTDIEKSPQAERFWSNIGESGRRTYTGRYHRQPWQTMPKRSRQGMSRQMNARRANPAIAYPNAPKKRVQSIKPRLGRGGTSEGDIDRTPAFVEGTMNKKPTKRTTKGEKVEKILPVIGAAARVVMGGKKILDSVTDDDDKEDKADITKRSRAWDMATAPLKAIIRKHLNPQSINHMADYSTFTIFYPRENEHKISGMMRELGTQLRSVEIREHLKGNKTINMLTIEYNSNLNKGKRMNSLIWGLVAGAGGFMLGQVLRDKLMGRGVPKTDVDRAVNDALNTTYRVHDQTARLVRKGAYIDISEDISEDVSQKAYQTHNIVVGNNVKVNGDEGRVVSLTKSHATIAFKNGNTSPVHIKSIVNLDEDYFPLNKELVTWDNLELRNRQEVLAKCRLPNVIVGKSWGSLEQNVRNIIMKFMHEETDSSKIAPLVNDNMEAEKADNTVNIPVSKSDVMINPWVNKGEVGKASIDEQYIGDYWDALPSHRRKGILSQMGSSSFYKQTYASLPRDLKAAIGSHFKKWSSKSDNTVNIPVSKSDVMRSPWVNKSEEEESTTKGWKKRDREMGGGYDIVDGYDRSNRRPPSKREAPQVRRRIQVGMQNLKADIAQLESDLYSDDI